MTRVNLLRPRLPSRQSGVRRRMLYVGSMLLLLILASVGVHHRSLAEQRMAARSVSSVEAQLVAEMARVTEWQAMRKEIDRLEVRLGLLDQIPPARDGLAALAGAIRTAAEPGCRVESLAFDPNGGLMVKGSAGSHGDVADYIDRLRSMPGVSGLELQSSVRSAADGRVSFDLRGTIGGRLE